MSDLPRGLLDLLRCPRCLGELATEQDALRCDACAVRYPVRDGIPMMLLSDATTTEEREPG